MTTTSSPFVRALAAGVRANVPTLIWGIPGQAKTATLTAAAEAWDMHLEVIIGSTREATDFLGVMVEKDGEVSYSSFGWMNRLNNTTRSGGLCLLDEFNTAGPATMKGQLRFVQERVVGEQRLNDNVAIVAIANPTDVAVDAYDLPAPMANRFMHLDWVFDSKYWLENVTTGFDQDPVEPLGMILSANPDVRRAAVGGSVAAFLRSKPKLLTADLTELDEVQKGLAWASPRSWTNVIAVLSQLEANDTDAALLVVQGLVGAGPASEYFKWLAKQDLYDPKEVLNDPSIVDWTSRPDRIFSLIQSITALGLMNEDDWHPAIKVLTFCARANRADVASGGALKLGNAIPKGKRLPQPFLDAFTGLFTKTLHRVSV